MVDVHDVLVIFEKFSFSSVLVSNAETTLIVTFVEYAPDVNVATLSPTSASVGVHEKVPLENVAPSMPAKEMGAATPVAAICAVTAKATVSPAKTSPAGAPVTVKSTFCASSSVVTQMLAECGESPTCMLSPSARTRTSYSPPGVRLSSSIDVDAAVQDPATSSASHTS